MVSPVKSISLVLLLAIPWLAIPCHAQNFRVVVNGNRSKAEAIGRRAAECRREIAVAWFGEELPDWRNPCLIVWHEGGSSGQGVTSYNDGPSFDSQMRMQISGRWDRLIDDVIPHEVFHLVIRHRLGFTPPRWMNEGGASTAESDWSVTRHEHMLNKFLAERRVPPINRMMMARDYPSDVMPFYAASVSISRFLIGSGGPDKWLRLGSRYRSSGDWTVACREVYGYSSLADLQTDWMRWVSAGCPGEIKATLAKPIPRSQAPYRPDRMVSVSQGAAGQCSTGQCVPQTTMAPVYPSRQSSRQSSQTKPGPQGPQGPQGPPGEQGPQGPKGPPWEPTEDDLNKIAEMVDPNVSEDQMRAIVQAVINSMPETPVTARGSNGEMIDVGILRLGETFDIPPLPGTDPSSMTAEEIASLAQRIQPELDPVTLQPGYRDEDGQIQPYKQAEPIVGRLGGTALLPPNRIRTYGVSGATETQAPIGGVAELRINRGEE